MRRLVGERHRKAGSRAAEEHRCLHIEKARYSGISAAEHDGVKMISITHLHPTNHVLKLHDVYDSYLHAVRVSTCCASVVGTSEQGQSFFGHTY